MKKILITFLLGAIMNNLYAETPFCSGFEEGFNQGYCDGKVACVPPVAPVCPVEKYNESTYQDGYNRGFKTGLLKKQ